MTITISLENEVETTALGARLSLLLRKGDVICLSGELGAGKSTLARGLIKALCGEEEAPSPTFTFVETYDAGDFTLWHFDFYRLEQPGDVWELGYEDALHDGAVLIEWPERVGALIPDDALKIRLEIDGARRHARFEGENDWLRRLADAGIASR